MLGRWLSSKIDSNPFAWFVVVSCLRFLGDFAIVLVPQSLALVMDGFLKYLRSTGLSPSVIFNVFYFVHCHCAGGWGGRTADGRIWQS